MSSHFLCSKGVEHLRTLFHLILSNSEARKLFSDASLIGRDLFARGASHLAEKARPDQDALARADEPAPSDEWKTENADEDISRLDIAQSTTQEASAKKEEIKGIVKTEAEGLQQDISSKRDGGEQTETVKRTFMERLTGNNGGRVPPGGREQVRRGAEEARGVREDVETAPTDDPGEQADVAKKSLKERFNGLIEKVPQEHRDTARDQYEKGIDFLKDEFPEERRDQFIYRLKKVRFSALTWKPVNHLILLLGHCRMSETPRLSGGSHLVPRSH